MYADGWKVVTNHVNQLTHAERDLIDGSSDFAQDHWHLFDTGSDIAENHDLGEQFPQHRDELIARWFAEAERNNVLPLSDGVFDRLAHLLLPWSAGLPSVELRPGERLFEDSKGFFGLSVNKLFTEENFKNFAPAIGRSSVVPHVGQAFGAAQVADAHRHLESGAARGKVLLQWA